MKRGKLVVLLVDDDENDIVFFQAATARGGAGHTVHAVPDAAEAIGYLQGRGRYADRVHFPLPNVVLCDLKMHGMSGFEFLQWLREHPQCSIIPTIILSSSALEDDVRRSYQLGANAFITKPSTLEGLVDLLRALYEFWSRCECPATLGV